MTEETKKLADLIPGDGTNLVYISGHLGDQNINCDGPVEIGFKITKPTWPYIPATSEYSPEGFKNPVFDFPNGTWIEQDEDSQGQKLAELTKDFEKIEKENKDLKEENRMLKEVLQQVQKGQIQTTGVLGELLPAVQQLSKFASNLQKQETKGDEK